MAALRRTARVAMRIVVAAACCAGIWFSLQLARADYFFRQDTLQSVRSAIGIAPDAWEYYMRLAQLDPGHAKDDLAQSLRLNRYDAQADIELALQYEADGDLGHAEKQLLDAYNVDHTYLPRWSLANYYLRRGDLPGFWGWARSAADMPADDIRALLELCWRVSPDPETLTAKLLNEKPEMLRQYAHFLLEKDRADAAAAIAPHLLRLGDAESDRALMFATINQLVAGNQGAGANNLWRTLMQRHWVEADSTLPNNPDFQRGPLPVAFDWALPEYQGLHSWPGPSGLETEFAGGEPEDSVIAEQAIYLTPGTYTLDYAYRTSEIPEGTGIRWQILDYKSGAVIAESLDLSSDELKHSKLVFTIPPESTLVRLRLGYRRALGTPRISGSLAVVSTQIRVLP